MKSKRARQLMKWQSNQSCSPVLWSGRMSSPTSFENLSSPPSDLFTDVSKNFRNGVVDKGTPTDCRSVSEGCSRARSRRKISESVGLKCTQTFFQASKYSIATALHTVAAKIKRTIIYTGIKYGEHHRDGWEKRKTERYQNLIR